MFVIELLAQQNPFQYMVDENNRTCWSVNFLGRANTNEGLAPVIAKRLQDNAIGTPGTSIFTGGVAQIPKGDGPYILITVTGGVSDLETHNRDYQRSISFQLTVRALDAELCEQTINAARNALDGIRNTTLTA